MEKVSIGGQTQVKIIIGSNDNPIVSQSCGNVSITMLKYYNWEIVAILT